MRETIRVRVKLVGVLKPLAGSDEIVLELDKGSTVLDALVKLAEQRRALRDRLFWRDDEIYPDLYIAVNDVDIRLLDGLKTVLSDGDKIVIIPYIHGG